MSQVKAHLQITLDISDENRPAAAKVYNDYRKPFLDTIEGAVSKNLQSDMFKNDVFVGLQPLWKQDPDVRIYGL